MAGIKRNYNEAFGSNAPQGNVIPKWFLEVEGFKTGKKVGDKMKDLIPIDTFVDKQTVDIAGSSPLAYPDCPSGKIAEPVRVELNENNLSIFISNCINKGEIIKSIKIRKGFFANGKFECRKLMEYLNCRVVLREDTDETTIFSFIFLTRIAKHIESGAEGDAKGVTASIIKFDSLGTEE